MGKHNKPRRYNRGGQIAVAAAAATVLAGWAAPVAYADEGADTDKPSNPVSRTADAVKSTVDGVRKAVRDVGSSVQGAARDGLQVGSGGAGSLLRPNSNSPRSTVSARTVTGSQRSSDPVASVVVPDTPDPSVVR